MVSAKLFVEGSAQGPNSKLLQTRCREGFRKLLEKCGFAGRMPNIAACGSRGNAFRDFSTAHANSNSGTFLALLVDSEDPVANLEQTWTHLKSRDCWKKPDGADDEQVLFMTTCMETWIISDLPTLRLHFGADLLENALPNLHDMENRDRHSIQDALEKATRNCQNKYQKGKRSFEILSLLSPVELRKFLPSFVRCERVLNAKLK